VRAALVSLVLASVLAVGVPAVAVAAEPRFVAPVPGAVVDPWRPPGGAFGAGNRGIDLLASPGDEVRAAAGGEVVFAAAIAGATHVVVLHPDGLRTTYAFLAGATVRRGDQVRQGDVVGIAAGPVHFGVRAGDRYLDPTALLAGAVEVHLVPERDRRPLSEAGERNGVLSLIGGVLHGAGSALGWIVDRGADGATFAAYITEWAVRTGWDNVVAELRRLGTMAVLIAYYTSLPREWLAVLRRMSAYRDDQRGCTPGSVEPPRPAGRRIAVLVGGLGSDGDHAAIDDLDTEALGYDAVDVARFSYGGGQVDATAGRPGVDGVARTDYEAADTAVDLRESAAELQSLIADIRIAHPGVPIDVIGHSQGGVVARAALQDVAPADPRYATVANLITIGAPHHGADVATGAAWLNTSDTGAATMLAAGHLTPFDGAAPAVAQLSETSSFVRQLGEGRLAPDVQFRSIASSGDLVVPAVHSAVDDAVNTLVPDQPGASVHGDLPASDAVRREIALALAGIGPTCRSVTGAFLLSFGTSLFEDVVGFGLGTFAHYVDARARVAISPGRPTHPPGR
jgi:hypothetical protein